MKKLLIAAMALLSLVAFANAAKAADPVDISYDWSGAYVGLSAGYAFGDNKWYARAVPGADSLSDDFDGFVGGGTLGYNFQVDSIVFGLEGDMSFADIHSKAATSPVFGCGAGCETDVDWFSTVRGRLGYAIDRTLPYITGGLAIAEAKASSAGFGTLGKKSLTGWTIGAGVEHAFTDNFTVKAEVLYVDVGRLNISLPCGGSCATDVDFTTARLGLNYKF